MLWVGRLLENPNVALPPPASAYRLDVEQFGGSIFTHPTTGEVIFIASGINNSPVYRITGWDRFQRQQGTVDVF